MDGARDHAAGLGTDPSRGVPVENDRVDLLIAVQPSQGGLDRVGAHHARRLAHFARMAATLRSSPSSAMISMIVKGAEQSIGADESVTPGLEPTVILPVLFGSLRLLGKQARVDDISMTVL
jgi:hypothetical protein